MDSTKTAWYGKLNPYVYSTVEVQCTDKLATSLGGIIINYCMYDQAYVSWMLFICGDMFNYIFQKTKLWVMVQYAQINDGSCIFAHKFSNWVPMKDDCIYP